MSLLPREIQIDYFNYEHGGRKGADFLGHGREFNFSGLVKAMSTGRYPDVLVIGEADRWDDTGGHGMYEACAALRKAGSPPYVPLMAELPRKWGPFAPAILYNPATIEVRRYFDAGLPYAADRTDNLFLATTPGSNQWFGVVPFHGDIHIGDARLADVARFDRFADLSQKIAPWLNREEGSEVPLVIAGDFNATLDGPPDKSDFNTPKVEHQAWTRAHKIIPDFANLGGPHRADTRAPDWLCGQWNAEKGIRENGLGFHCVAELEGNLTPTQYERPNGRAPRLIDMFLVNDAMKKRLVPGSYVVHEAADPNNPPSDHKRISMRVRLG